MHEVVDFFEYFLFLRVLVLDYVFQAVLVGFFLDFFLLDFVIFVVVGEFLVVEDLVAAAAVVPELGVDLSAVGTLHRFQGILLDLVFLVYLLAVLVFQGSEQVFLHEFDVVLRSIAVLGPAEEFP